MTRKSAALILALVAAVVGFITIVVARHHNAAKSLIGELEWLKQEFSISDEGFARIETLHAAHHANCLMLCEALLTKRRTLSQHLETHGPGSTQVEQALRDVAAAETACRAAILTHSFEVSQEMSEPNAQRYRNLVRERVVGSLSAMPHHPEH